MHHQIAEHEDAGAKFGDAIKIAHGIAGGGRSDADDAAGMAGLFQQARSRCGAGGFLISEMRQFGRIRQGIGAAGMGNHAGKIWAQCSGDGDEGRAIIEADASAVAINIQLDQGRQFAARRSRTDRSGHGDMVGDDGEIDALFAQRLHRRDLLR